MSDEKEFQLPEGVFEAARAKHKRVFVYRYTDLDLEPRALLFRPLSAAEYKEIVAKLAGDLDEGKSRPTLASVQAQAFRDCVVWPGREEHDALLDDAPGLASRVGDELMALARGDGVRRAKKA